MTDEFKIDAKNHIRTIRALVEAAKAIVETAAKEKIDEAIKAQTAIFDEALAEIDALHEKAEK